MKKKMKKKQLKAEQVGMKKKATKPVGRKRIIGGGEGTPWK